MPMITQYRHYKKWVTQMNNMRATTILVKKEKLLRASLMTMTQHGAALPHLILLMSLTALTNITEFRK